MFYSQFILAKKGPLGTIWIAAHLERKLRKNQVADTDIGVSVDSILFPEVPIALRLSSHLLLGVVRIYSRKVNYLFDDCSEALLKIKQAFRSTAVDLPPEESTAPYHSITLPETFDLDDFELPDNDILQGNYVDHHVSTREQITLQDTMEGVVFSTSQFGLDERFGDGDTSQVGLDLEEDLLVDKVTAARNDEISENDVRESIEIMLHPTTDASYIRSTGSSEEMTLNGTMDKISGPATNSEFVDDAPVPSTPGLLEEPNVSSVKESVAYHDHLELEGHIREAIGKSSDETHRKSDFNCREDSLVSMHSEENSCLSGELEINQAATEEEVLSKAVTTENILADKSVGTLDGLENVENKIKVVSCNNEQTSPLTDQINGECKELAVKSHETDVEIVRSIDESCLNGNAAVSVQPLEFQESLNVEGQGQDFQGLVIPEMSNSHNNSNEEMTPTCSGFLWPCNSHLRNPEESTQANKSVDVEAVSFDTHQRVEGFDVSGASTKVQGEDWHVSDGLQSEENRISQPTLNGEIQEDEGKQDEQQDNVISITARFPAHEKVGLQSEENRIPEPTLNGKIQEDGGKQDEPLDNVISKDNHCENLDSSMTSDFPAPEKVLSVPLRLFDELHDLLLETPNNEVRAECDESGSGTNITGKKRTFAESSVTAQTLNSVEFFGVSRSKRTLDSVPDDDDLLSSILVGRRSSVLKMKPTPRAPDVPPTKRARSTSRISALKRKVLIDDSMVLHGDIIRLQLTNTDDIRRLRKKAPCTSTEILMIQRQFLEEEIFNEPVLTGTSVNLTHLHSKALDLSRIRVTENNDSNNASIEKGFDDNSSWKSVPHGREMEGSRNTGTCRIDADGNPSGLPVQNGNQQVEDHLGSYDIDCQDHRIRTAEEVDFRSSVQDHLEEIGEMEIDKVNSEVAGDNSEMPTGNADQLTITNFMQMDTPCLPSDKIDTQLVEEVLFLKDMNNVIGLDGIDATDHSAEKIVAAETELRTEEEDLLEESKMNAPVEMRADEQADGSAPNDDANASVTNLSLENGGHIDFDSINVDLDLEKIENDKRGICNEDGSVGVSSRCIDEKVQTSNHLCDEESKVNPTYSAGLDGDLKDASTSYGDYTIDQQTDYHKSMDAQSAPLCHVTAEECDNIQGVALENDTGFLNVDDDEIGEDDDEGMPNTEDTRLLENTGWSSRTRAVAKYLQILFDKEAGHGGKILSMDNLLAGKTRKEASRMFFETLVLKTRDYVQVEQAKPFDSINIKPQPKLMISEFC